MSAAEQQHRKNVLEGVSIRTVKESQEPEGFQSVTVIRPNLVLVRISGAIPSGPGTASVSGLLADAVAATPGVAVFFDLEGFHRYDSQVRVAYTDAIRVNLKNARAVYIYADNKLVRMGSSVAGLVIPQLQIVDLQRFEKLLEGALKA